MPTLSISRYIYRLNAAPLRSLRQNGKGFGVKQCGLWVVFLIQINELGGSEWTPY